MRLQRGFAGAFLFFMRFFISFGQCAARVMRLFSFCFLGGRYAPF